MVFYNVKWKRFDNGKQETGGWNNINWEGDEKSLINHIKLIINTGPTNEPYQFYIEKV